MAILWVHFTEYCLLSRCLDFVAASRTPPTSRTGGSGGVFPPFRGRSGVRDLALSPHEEIHPRHHRCNGPPPV